VVETAVLYMYASLQYFAAEVVTGGAAMHPVRRGLSREDASPQAMASLTPAQLRLMSVISNRKALS
jgi:hypothetical protein